MSHPPLAGVMAQDLSPCWRRVMQLRGKDTDSPNIQKPQGLALPHGAEILAALDDEISDDSTTKSTAAPRNWHEYSRTARCSKS
jgi:hypothetical protein